METQSHRTIQNVNIYFAIVKRHPTHDKHINIFLTVRLFKFRLEISSIDKNDEDKLMYDFINRLMICLLFSQELRTSFYSLSMA